MVSFKYLSYFSSMILAKATHPLKNKLFNNYLIYSAVELNKITLMHSNSDNYVEKLNIVIKESDRHYHLHKMYPAFKWKGSQMNLGT